MKVEDIRANILDPKKLRLPPKPKVIDLKVSPYVDHHGDDALWIYIILDDATTRAERTGPNLNRIDRAISEALIAAGIDLFPYTLTVTPSDLKEAKIEL
jgi:hypothetical protein